MHYKRKHDGETAAYELDGMAMADHVMKAALLGEGSPSTSDASSPAASPIVSRVIALHNLVAPGQPPDDNLAAEVRDECARFGSVCNVRVAFVRPSGSAQAETVAFVRFDHPSAATSALATLNGRIFDGRRVTARLYSEDRFHAQDWSATVASP